MDIGVFALIAVNLVLYSGVALWAFKYSRSDGSARMRLLAKGLGLVALAFVLGASTRLLGVAVGLGWLPGRVSEFILSGWHLIQALLATLLGLGGILLLRRATRAIETADRIASAVSERFLEVGDLSELGLTEREMDVLKAIAAGQISDQDLADALFISPATAATHVRNILRKTGVRSRRDLALLAASDTAG